MSVFTISYKDLWAASSNAKKASDEIDDYVKRLGSKVTTKLSNISCEETSRIEKALTLTNQKILQLNKKSDNLVTFSDEIKNFSKKVQNVDTAVKEKIKSISNKFAKSNDIDPGIISKIIYICSQEIEFELNDLLGKYGLNANDIGEAFKKLSNNIKAWWRTGGKDLIWDIGKSAVMIVGGIVSIVGAVIAVGAGGLTILLGLAILGGVLSIIDGVTNLFWAGKAYSDSDENPAWAKVMGDNDSAADGLRFIGKKEAAMVFDILGLVSAIGGGIDSVKDIFKSGKKIINGSGFSSLKNLFTGAGKKTEGHLYKAFTEFNPQGKRKLTFKSIFNGSKSLLNKESKVRLDIFDFIGELKTWGAIKIDDLSELGSLKGLKQAGTSIVKQGSKIFKGLTSNGNMDSTFNLLDGKDALKYGKFTIDLTTDNGYKILENTVKLKQFNNTLKLLDSSIKSDFKAILKNTYLPNISKFQGKIKSSITNYNNLAY